MPVSIGKAGQSYLLFLYTKQDRGWALDGCGNSGQIEKKEAALQEIAALQKHKGGMIQVAVGGAGPPAMTGVEVDVRGTSATYSGKTNQDGIAEIHVPVGQYSVTVPNQRVTPFDFTYDDPHNIVIENGSCAQIQFVEASNK